MAEERALPIQLTGLETEYDQVQLMAIGGMAEVYRSRQKNLNRPVAIKRMRPEMRGNRDLKERFRREATSSANLLHQNLAHVYDYRTVGDESYIIMEYIDGFDLAEIIERSGPLPIDVASMVALRVLNGLSHIHSHGMVHRDLKPDNVRVSTRGEIKIMDFGIAYDPTESSLTVPGTLIGSPHYLSPEQIVGQKMDARVDLFAFGVTFYEMLTAKKPFFETQGETVYSRIQKGHYLPIESLRAEVPGFLIKIIESCLEVNPAKRPASADAIATALGQFLANHYSHSVTARIRQYLIQANLLQGNARLIDVGERTLGGYSPPFMSRYKREVALILLVAFAGAVFFVWRHRLSSEVIPHSSVPAAPLRSSSRTRLPALPIPGRQPTH